MAEWTLVGLWIVQGVLALVFLMGGSMKALAYERAKASLPWVREVDARLVRTIGALEILGGIGVIAPRATDILPWLTPLAATGLALVMLLAIGFHARRGERQAIVVNGVLLVLAVIAAVGTMALI